MESSPARQQVTGFEPVAQGVHVVAKPVGPACNLGCEYCFYLEKKALFPAREKYVMSDRVLSAFIANYIESQPTPEVQFVWQGGEPTLAGIEFYERVVALQRRYLSRKTITNSLQTNGTRLTPEWCRFLARHHFMVGISLDGPQDIHDRHRLDRRGRGTFDRVMNGLGLLQQHGVDYNVLACVTRESARRPLDVYRFFKEHNVEFIQFLPIVERWPDPASAQPGLGLAGPAWETGGGDVTEWSVIPGEYGDFLIAIYEEWVRRDVGRTFVMNFEWALNAWLGNPSPVCVHASQCGRSLVVEHNGDAFACDHCVYPAHRLGNVMTEALPSLAEKSLRSGFGVMKETALPRQCRECDVLPACGGGCPKQRFADSHHGEPGLHYLCPGYRRFFLHIRKYLRVMATLLENGLPASHVMETFHGPLVITRRDGDARS